MHVVFLTPEYVTQGRPEGGIANHLRKLGLELTERGHRVTVFCQSTRNAIWQDGLIRIIEVRITGLPKLFDRIPFFASISFMLRQLICARSFRRKILAMHRETPISVIHACSFLAPGHSLLTNRQIPMVCLVASYEPLLRSAQGRDRTLADRVLDKREVRQVKKASAAFVPSRFMAEKWAQYEGVKPMVIPTPLDGAPGHMDFSYYDDHLADQDYLLFVGRLDRLKGVDLLAQVVPELLRRYEHLRFVFAGENCYFPTDVPLGDHLCPGSRSQAQRVLYSGVLPKPLLYPVIQRALGIVTPSRIDNYPNVCLEALFFGRPVIGTYDSSLEEMIVDGETGFLAKNGDADDLRRAVERLLNLSGAQRVQMSENVLRHARRMQAEDRVTQVISLYKSVMNDSKAETRST